MEIRDFYEAHEERKDQMEYVRSLFPTGVTEYTLENGETVGFDKYENVLLYSVFICSTPDMKPMRNGKTRWNM